MKIFLKYILLFISISGFSQSPKEFAKSVPESISQNPKSLAQYFRNAFPDDNDFVESFYIWTTTNIKYTNETVDSLSDYDLVRYVLTTKSGKCKHFSALFTCICNMAGVEAYSVLGYVKLNNDIETTQDHAWNVIKIQNKFYLYDPTWDSGKDTVEYYKKNGSEFISTHMPYDPMMQLQKYPVSHTKYFKGKLQGRHIFDYNSALEEYKNLDAESQLKILLFRAEKYDLNNIKLAFLYIRLKHFVKDYSEFEF